MVVKYAQINRTGDRVANVIALAAPGVREWNGLPLVQLTGKVAVSPGDAYDGTHFTPAATPTPTPEPDPVERRSKADALKNATASAAAIKQATLDYLATKFPEDFA